MADPRFDSPEHPMRTAIGSAMLVGVGGRLLTALGRFPRFRHSAERLWAASVRRLLQMDVATTGLEFVDPDTQYVVAPLHEGFADAPVLLGLPLDLRFTARDELVEWPHLGRFLERSGQLLVPTGSSVAALRALARGAAATFDRHESLVVFPQGSILGIEAAFQPGAFWLAHRFDRPLLPVVVTGTHRVWEHPYSPRLRYRQPVSMSVLPPVPGQEALQRSAEIEREMKAVAVAEGMAPVRRFVPSRDGWWDGYDYEIDPTYEELAKSVAAHRDVVSGS